jgi:hypothetical protein
VLRGVPTRIDVTGAKPQGEAEERAVLEKSIEPDRCYVIDRGYAKFTLWNAIVAGHSSYVCRVRDNSAYEVEKSNALSAADLAAGVLSDEVVILGQSKPAEARPNHPVRLITIVATPHTSRGKHRPGSTGPNCDGKLRLVTNRLDLPAELISEIYRLRWLIELFFRMFKQLLGCRHLLSTKQNGVAIQAYSAIIACLLILLYTGHTPTKRTFEMISFYLIGWASLEELQRPSKKSTRRSKQSLLVGDDAGIRCCASLATSRVQSLVKEPREWFSNLLPTAPRIQCSSTPSNSKARAEQYWDGTVDSADYIVWRDNLGSSHALVNETASIGAVDGQDYDAWRANFGATAVRRADNPPLEAAALSAAVPEPSGLRFALVIAALTTCYRRPILPMKRRGLIQAIRSRANLE